MQSDRKRKKELRTMLNDDVCGRLCVFSDSGRIYKPTLIFVMSCFALAGLNDAVAGVSAVLLFSYMQPGQAIHLPLL